MEETKGKNTNTDTDNLVERRNKAPFRLTLDDSGLRSAGGSPSNSRASSPANVTILDLTWDEETSRSLKRKKMDARDVTDRPDENATPKKGEKLMAERLLKIIKGIDEEIRNISKVTRENTNTKKEIKEAAVRLRSLSSQMMTREVQDMLGKVGRSENATLKECNEAGTQTDPKIKKANIRVILEASKSFDQFKDLLDKRWPEEAFQKTKEGAGNPAKATTEDIALIVDPRDQGEKGLTKEMGDRYPEIKEMLKLKLEEGRIEYLINKTTVETSRSEAEERTKYIYFLPYEIDPNGVNDMSKFYAMASDWRERIRIHGREEILFAMPEGLNRDYVRKILEYVFKEDSITIKCLIPAGRPKGKVRNGQPGPSARDPEEAVVVKAKGKTYADLLKKVKEGVDIKKLGVDIKQVKKTYGGDLLLLVDGGAQMAETLKQEIQSKIQEVDVRTKREGVTTLFITGIDAASDETEITEELKSGTGTAAGEIKITGLRTGRFGNQVATIETKKEHATKLTRMGTIKIGWTRCKIAERIEITRCYRCLEFGHRAKDCKGASRAEDCLKCGKTGHHAKDCTNTAFCTKCQSNDHRADQTRCPHYRKLVEDRRALRRGNS